MMENAVANEVYRYNNLKPRSRSVCHEVFIDLRDIQQQQQHDDDVVVVGYEIDRGQGGAE